MLKTIAEKERITFVYAERLVPLILIVLAIAIGVSSVLLRDSLTSTLLTIFAFLALIMVGVAVWFWIQKQVLVIDQNQKILEEYLGDRRTVFSFHDLDWADIERLRDEEVLDPIEDLEKPALPVKSPHLNYHLFLKLKQPGKKYFLFDNNGKGLPDYSDARKIVKTINTSLGISKSVSDELNWPRLSSSSSKRMIFLFFLATVLLVVLYFVLKHQGYFLAIIDFFNRD